MNTKPEAGERRSRRGPMLGAARVGEGRGCGRRRVDSRVPLVCGVGVAHGFRLANGQELGDCLLTAPRRSLLTDLAM
jgi:hypothetical protein